MNIPARTEVILEEFKLDTIELLRQFVGVNNTKGLRDAVADLFTSYLYGFEEIQSAIVLCDEGNNPQDLADNGVLLVDSIFVIANQSFLACHSVVPSISGYNPDIEVEFFVRAQPVQERNVYFIDVGDAVFNLDAIQNAINEIDLDEEEEITNQMGLDFICDEDPVEFTATFQYGLDVEKELMEILSMNVGDVYPKDTVDSPYDDMPLALANSLKV